MAAAAAKAEHSRGMTKTASSVVDEDGVECDEEAVDDEAETEVKLLSKLHHPNVIRCEPCARCSPLHPAGRRTPCFRHKRLTFIRRRRHARVSAALSLPLSRSTRGAFDA